MMVILVSHVGGASPGFRAHDEGAGGGEAGDRHHVLLEIGNDLVPVLKFVLELLDQTL